MEFTKQNMKFLKGIAILFMLSLHLFCRKIVNGLYVTYPTVHGVPFIYYFGLFGDACVPIYCFASGYGLYISMRNPEGQLKKNGFRLLKLLINYWIILVVFVIVGLIIGNQSVPGNPEKLLLNFSLLSNTYNGAWWFLQTYVILVLLTPWLFKVVKKYSPIITIALSSIIYFVTYVQRIKHVIDLTHYPILNMIVNSLVLIGTSQLPFIFGAVFAKEKLYSRIYNKCSNLPFKNTLCLLGISALVLVHSIIQSMFIAPFTGIAFICLFTLINKNRSAKAFFNFFGNHSTNIWLTHMFFYMIFFPKLVFAPKYPVLIISWLLLLCILTSYGINIIYKPIIKRVDKIQLLMVDKNKKLRKIG